MKIKRILVILIIFCVCLSAVSAAAQDRGSFYVGGSFSLYDSTIIDQFTRYRRGNIIEKSTFEDEYTGQAYGFYFGYRLVNKKRVFINVQVHGNFFSKEFNVETSSSTVRRKLFCSRGIDLQPGYNITDNLFFFVNLSIERGRRNHDYPEREKTEISLQEQKKKSVQNHYGHNGCRIDFHILSCLTVKLNYIFKQYGTTEISSTVGALGRKVDVIELMPMYDHIMLAVQYNFGKK